VVEGDVNDNSVDKGPEKKPRWKRRRMLTLIVLFFHTLGFLSSVHAVMTNRTAQGAIAWGVSLNTFPYLTVPLYWVFGRRKFEGYVESWQERHEDVEALVAKVHDALDPYEVETLERIPNYEALKKIAHTPILRGNEVELLVDGEATFTSILDGLARAERYALVQFYIVRDDGLGRRLKAAMIDCRKRGVEVYFCTTRSGAKTCHDPTSRSWKRRGCSTPGSTPRRGGAIASS
jgi:cardiolipin synthase